jgi:hypothetical protein
VVALKRPSAEDIVMPLNPRPPRWTNPDIDEFIAKNGGLFWLKGDHKPATINLFNSLTAVFDRHVKLFESSLYMDRPRKISYGILCSTDFNALAYSTPSDVAPPLDFIGINVGVIFTILDTFARILAQPASFAEVGNPSLEDASRITFRPLTTNVMSLPPSSCRPVCPIRSIFAAQLAQTALNFLFFHELSHLRNGHCDYAREHLGVGSYLAERFSLGHETAERLIRQTLEMDADSGAIFRTLNEAFKLKDMLQTTTREIERDTKSALEAAYGDAQRATRFVAYAAYVLFRLFDDSGWDPVMQPAKTHPQPLVRMSWIGPTIYELFLHRPIYGYDAKDFANAMVAVVKDAETDCGRIQGLPPNPRGILNIYSPTERASSTYYLNSLASTWSSIRPYLEKYKRGGYVFSSPISAR